MGFWSRVTLAILAAAQLVAVGHCRKTDCSSLAQSTCLDGYNGTVLNTTYHTPGTLDVSGTRNRIPFCEVYASISYGNNNSLMFAVWLPDAKHYSSRFIAVGNGGQGGEINHADMMEELNNDLGFAVAGGNAGHLASDNMAGDIPGIGAPGVYQPFLHDETQVKAWMHDAINLFTPASKQLIETFYGKEPEFSYFRGCSAGGNQGLSLAELRPGLFNGIIAGCPANWFTLRFTAFANKMIQAPTRTLSQDKLEYIQAKVIEECDLLDGVKDNVIQNPLACSFNMSSLSCHGNIKMTNTTCLTSDQLEAVQALYHGPIRSEAHGTSLFPGLALGSEAGWGLPQVQGALSDAFTVPILQNLVYKNMSYNPDEFNWGSDVDFLESTAGPLINSIKTDLSSFKNRGGKMIVYAGWADPNISPHWSMEHVKAITRDTLGKEATIAENDFVKLVMIPGGGHCGSLNAKYPYVPAHYDFASSMIDWVERGIEPVAGIKTWGPENGENRTRRICTWPRAAKLKAGEDIDDWQSYECA
ncbi:tannase and feruloyl esterase [Fusarium longipes]|uniref:Carboxylic ester hydrolase n=1 Tax=Fusarium longipes TaxID=694270 RepID=A0A395SXE2_9HYPO|nr:tannase and feruloyl esterase [Fusarium longipes]